jgi:hypothetical protein
VAGEQLLALILQQIHAARDSNASWAIACRRAP